MGQECTVWQDVDFVNPVCFAFGDYTAEYNLSSEIPSLMFSLRHGHLLDDRWGGFKPATLWSQVGLQA